METQREYLYEMTAGALRFESVGDYILPDYNTDVKRVLLTRAEVVDTGCFVTDDGVEISGAVNYEVMYVDSENELTSASFSVDFSTQMKQHHEDAVACAADTRVTGYAVRLVGPRRFSVKAQLLADVRMTGKGMLAVDGTTFEVATPEVRSRDISVAHRLFAEPVEKEYTEVLTSLEDVIADDMTVLYSDCLPELDATASDGAVEVSGVLHVRALVKRDDELPALVSTDIAVKENIDLDGAEYGIDADLTTDVSGVQIDVEQGEDGITMLAKVTVEYTVSAIKNETMTVILDAYLTDKEVENVYEDFSYSEHLGTETACESLVFTLPYEELGCEALRDVLVTNGIVRIDEAVPTASGVKILGLVRISGVACQINEDGTLGFTAIRRDEPIEINVNKTCQNTPFVKALCHADATMVCAIATPTGVELSMDLKLFVSYECHTTVRRLSASFATEDTACSDGTTVTVYYPLENETLYDVGRKFHARPIDIAADNSLTEAVFADDGAGLKSLGIKHLIIR